MSEISGMIRNSIERGWAMDEIRTSLLNAGYNMQEIDSELRSYSISQQAQTRPSIQVINQVPQLPQQDTQQSQMIPVQIQPDAKYNPQSLKNYQTPEVKKQTSKTMVTIIVVLLVICIAAGAALFLFG
jgi:hypothetical protein